MIEFTKLDNIILRSLSRITSDYFATIYCNILNLRQQLNNRNGVFINEDFLSYGERIFCYEFYHQLRQEEETIKEFDSGLKIQGEARKMNIIELLEKLDLNEFSSDLIPDILIHNPENASHQLCAIEVKVIDNLSTNQLSVDLRKLNTYCDKLKYQNAYFITINTSSNHIKNLLDDPNLNLNELTEKNKIKIICKENADSNSKIWQL